ncbi:hypothetical protein M9H77_26868 [Catharanthus roseus]|uniref:Uncharacterized protein n=1 Tax=Catharanthus roseus TaxID=4058 RepID=A0ACC0AB44_CATRO|nr:hypothetical protein M9H77_26868 [Catharanthus roseus]
MFLHITAGRRSQVAATVSVASPSPVYRYYHRKLLVALAAEKRTEEGDPKDSRRREEEERESNRESQRGSKAGFATQRGTDLMPLKNWHCFGLFLAFDPYFLDKINSKSSRTAIQGKLFIDYVLVEMDRWHS